MNANNLRGWIICPGVHAEESHAVYVFGGEIVRCLCGIGLEIVGDDEDTCIPMAHVPEDAPLSKSEPVIGRVYVAHPLHKHVLCAVCGRDAEIGEDTTWDDEKQDYVCDQCARVERDPHGCAWSAGETQKSFDEDGLMWTYTREQAFNGRSN